MVVVEVVVVVVVVVITVVVVFVVVFALSIPAVDITEQDPSIIAAIVSNFLFLMVDISE